MRTPRLLSSWLGAVALMSMVACRDGMESPVAPPSEPALATTITALSFRQVSAGDFHTCGVTTDNRAYCWGQNSAGALGDGMTMTYSLKPVPVTGGLRFLQVSVGSEYTCAITTEYKAYCWGENLRGKLGDGTTTNRSTPVPVVGSYRFSQVNSGYLHTCAVTRSNEAFCWGDNQYGQLGDTSGVTRRQRPVPVVGGLHFQHVVAGALYSCGLATDNKAYCWGDGRGGQLGNGSTSKRRIPTVVAGRFSWSQVAAGNIHAAGGAHTCGVTTAHRAYCWGGNDKGQLGDGTTTSRLKPVAVAGGPQFSGLSPSSEHTCGLTTGGRAYCWGWRYNGALGDGSPLGDVSPPRLTPIGVVGGLTFSRLNTGRDHTCGVTTGNAAFCWGADNAGQLGDGAQTNTSRPVAVSGVN